MKKRKIKVVSVIALGVVAAILVGGAIRFATGQTGRAADHAALRKIAAAYEGALNSQDFDKLKPYLAPTLSAVMATGNEVTSPAEFKAYLTKVNTLIGIGKGGSYQVKVNPIATHFEGAYGYSFGTTDEILKTDAGAEYRYHSMWMARSRKFKDGWKLIGGRVVVDPFNQAFTPEHLQAIAKLVTG